MLALPLALALSLAAPNAARAQASACLITKTDTNPFFVRMKEGAEARAKELGLSLRAHAGRIDGDHESQVAAVETCMAAGVDGILVIALDTPLDPNDAADATFATDNFLAG